MTDADFIITVLIQFKFYFTLLCLNFTLQNYNTGMKLPNY